MELFFREAGAGYPIIILHGLFGSSDNWLTVTKKVAERYKVVLPDQRNHGQSGHSEEFTYESMAADLKSFIEQQRIEQPVVMGHSMGGKVAMKFALTYPDMPKKLIVVDIAPRYYPIHHGKILEGLNAINLDNLRNRKDAEIALGQYEPRKPVVQFLLKNLYRNEHGGFSWRINLPIITQKIENVGEKIEASDAVNLPTLFVGGAQSDYITDDDHEEIRHLFPQAQIKAIPDAGHWVHAEQPNRFLKAIFDFI